MQELLGHKKAVANTHPRNNKTGLCNSFPGNDSVNTYRHATILEQCFLCVRAMVSRVDLCCIHYSAVCITKHLKHNCINYISVIYYRETAPLQKRYEENTKDEMKGMIFD
jgi:hypothetical protein